VHDIIYTELVRGVTTDASKHACMKVVNELIAAGAEGVIAGCTEIELLVGLKDVEIPYFPTTAIHATAAAKFALSG
jgi:aspartate racemase